jgi:hypothetical protein
VEPGWVPKGVVNGDVNELRPSEHKAIAEARKSGSHDGEPEIDKIVDVAQRRRAIVAGVKRNYQMGEMTLRDVRRALHAAGEESVEMDREALHAALDEFLDGIDVLQPDEENGEVHTLTITGGCSGYTDNDQRFASFAVTKTQTHIR